MPWEEVEEKGPKGTGQNGFQSGPFSDIFFASCLCYVRLCLYVLCAPGWHWEGLGEGGGEEG